MLKAILKIETVVEGSDAIQDLADGLANLKESHWESQSLAWNL